MSQMDASILCWVFAAWHDYEGQQKRTQHGWGFGRRTLGIPQTEVQHVAKINRTYPLVFFRRKAMENHNVHGENSLSIDHSFNSYRKLPECIQMTCALVAPCSSCSLYKVQRQGGLSTHRAMSQVPMFSQQRSRSPRRHGNQWGNHGAIEGWTRCPPGP